jgi:hypothetical protein
LVGEGRPDGEGNLEMMNVTDRTDGKQKHTPRRESQML